MARNVCQLDHAGGVGWRHRAARRHRRAVQLDHRGRERHLDDQRGLRRRPGHRQRRHREGVRLDDRRLLRRRRHDRLRQWRRRSFPGHARRAKCALSQQREHPRGTRGLTARGQELAHSRRGPLRRARECRGRPPHRRQPRRWRRGRRPQYFAHRHRRLVRSGRQAAAPPACDRRAQLHAARRRRHRAAPMRRWRSWRDLRPFHSLHHVVHEHVGRAADRITLVRMRSAGRDEALRLTHPRPRGSLCRARSVHAGHRLRRTRRRAGRAGPDAAGRVGAQSQLVARLLHHRRRPHVPQSLATRRAHAVPRGQWQRLLRARARPDGPDVPCVRPR